MATQQNFSTATQLWCRLIEALSVMRANRQIDNNDYFMANREIDAAYWDGRTVEESITGMSDTANKYGIELSGGLL